MLEVRMLGQFDVRLNSHATQIKSRPAQSLFAYLVLNPGIPHRREMLAGLLWPDSTESNGRSYLRHALWRIRQALGDDYLLADNISIAYDPAQELWLDVSELEELFAEGVPIERYYEQVSVYEGELLPGFYDDWIVPQRERLQSTFDYKMDVLLATLVREGRWHEVLEWGERWIALSHAPEPAYRALMEAQGALGNRAAVQSVFERCVEALESELGVEPSEQTRDTYETLIRGENRASDIDPGPDVHPGTFIFHSSSFVGRQKEIEEITERLSDPSCRLLTLVGPGGIGKTRLALEIAGRHESDTFLVSLASKTSASLLIPSIAEVLGLSFYGGQDPKTRLLDRLHDMRALLVLDTLEHLLDGTDLLSEILHAAPDVKILATSRERLNLQSEWLFEVQGMDFPAGSRVTKDEIEEHGAVELFLQSARQLESGFSLTDGDWPYLARICQLVEGMPLAVE